MENINIVIHYFWLLKYLLILVFAWTLYTAVVVHKFKHKVWNVVAGIFLVLSIVSPVKLQVDVQSVHKAQDKAQAVLKIVPLKVEDKSFDASVKDVKGISKEDLK